MSKDGLEILEHPFITLRSFPDGFVQRIGGLVSHKMLITLLKGFGSLEVFCRYAVVQ